MSKTYLESLRMLLLPLMLMNGDVNVKTIVLTNINLTSKQLNLRQGRLAFTSCATLLICVVLCPIGFPLYDKYVRMVEEPVKDYVCHHRIPEHVSPFEKLEIHRHGRRFLLVSSCDELEKQACVIPVYRKISRLIDLHRRLGLRLRRENPGRPYVQLFLKLLDDSVALLQFGICQKQFGFKLLISFF